MQWSEAHIIKLYEEGKILGYKSNGGGNGKPNGETGDLGKKKSKYGNKKVNYDGILFDSKKECIHYQHLKVRLLIGEIKDLELQPVFELIPKTAKHRKVEYIADFRYIEVATGETKVVDVKSKITRNVRTYINKKKHMYEKFGIEIIEV